MESRSLTTEPTSSPYPKWQKFLRDNQPKSLIFWVQYDIFLLEKEVKALVIPNARDAENSDLVHFAVEDCLDEIANGIISFYLEKVSNGSNRKVVNTK